MIVKPEPTETKPPKVFVLMRADGDTWELLGVYAQERAALFQAASRITNEDLEESDMYEDDEENANFITAAYDNRDYWEVFKTWNDWCASEDSCSAYKLESVDYFI